MSAIHSFTKPRNKPVKTDKPTTASNNIIHCTQYHVSSPGRGQSNHSFASYQQAFFAKDVHDHDYPNYSQQPCTYPLVCCILRNNLYDASEKLKLERSALAECGQLLHNIGFFCTHCFSETQAAWLLNLRPAYALTLLEQALLQRSRFSLFNERNGSRLSLFLKSHLNTFRLRRLRRHSWYINLCNFILENTAFFLNHRNMRHNRLRG